MKCRKNTSQMVESLMKSMRDKTSICRLRATFRWESNQIRINRKMLKETDAFTYKHEMKD